MCTNATVYFPRSSQESIAAVHIRYLVTREISSTLPELTVPSPPSAKERTSMPAQHSPSIPPNSEPKPDTPPLDKKPVAPLPPLVACRKRSSITAKPSVKKNEKPKQESIIDEKDKDKDKVENKKKKRKTMPEHIIDENEKEEKSKKKREKEKEEKEEEVVDKKSTKQQRSVVARGLRTNKTRSGSKVAAKSQTIATKEEPEPKAEQETKPPAVSAAKKRSAAKFLNRMKRSTPSSSNGTLLDELKTTASTASGRGSDHQKKKSREESRKEKEKERESTAVKRTVGRPPKRTVASSAKRLREEKTPKPTTLKKRARR